MSRRTWSRNWAALIDDVIDDAVDARERLRVKNPEHPLLQYVAEPTKQGWAVERFCGKFFPPELGDWKTIPVGAAIHASAEAYTEEVEEALK